jgi:hypothetical protein
MLSSQLQTKAIRSGTGEISGSRLGLAARRAYMAAHTPMRDTRLPPLPSLFSPVALREGGDAMAEAVRLAPVQGAGTLAWVGAYARAEAALVLEPELPLAEARLALLAGCTALADALAADAPTEIPGPFRGSATRLVTGAECCRLALTAPSGAAADAVPDWLVLGMEIALQPRESAEPGLAPDRTTLAEEGWEAPDAALLTAAWARHLMAGLDDWQARGPRRLCEHFLARLAGHAGRRGIDPKTGDLLLPDRRIPLA